MRKSKIISLLFLFTLCLTLSTSAQEKEKRYQAFLISEDYVIPSMSYEYEEITKEFVALLKKSNYEYPMHIFSTDDYYYYISTPIGMAYSYLDSLQASYGKVFSENKEKATEIFKKFEGCYHYNKQYTIFYDNAVSFTPKELGYNSGERHFLELTFVDIHVGMRDEFSALLKKYVEFYKKLNSPVGFETYWGGLGTEEPSAMWVFRGTTQIDYLTKSEEAKKLFKDSKKEVQELWKKTLKTIRKMDTKQAYYRPKLSYEPTKK